jgi:hypothetical protein
MQDDGLACHDVVLQPVGTRGTPCGMPVCTALQNINTVALDMHTRLTRALVCIVSTPAAVKCTAHASVKNIWQPVT